MQATEQSNALGAAFHRRLHAANMYGLWELASQMTPQPQPKMIAYMWPWSVLEPLITESAQAVPVGDERRALQLFNPGLAGRWATTNKTPRCSRPWGCSMRRRTPSMTAINM